MVYSREKTVAGATAYCEGNYLMKIMIVDDDPDVVEAITLSFNIQWPESTLVAALDGRSALQKFDREHPDVVLLDIALPDTDGFEVCRLIRERSDVPILMIS